jgi:hypothetical protein
LAEAVEAAGDAVGLVAAIGADTPRLGAGAGCEGAGRPGAVTSGVSFDFGFGFATTVGAAFPVPRGPVSNDVADPGLTTRPAASTVTLIGSRFGRNEGGGVPNWAACTLASTSRRRFAFSASARVRVTTLLTGGFFFAIFRY